jgi:hypothetical protein
VTCAKAAHTLFVRQRSEARATKRLYSAIENYRGLGLSVGKVDDHRLDTAVPTPPTTYQEFLVFLQRYYTLLQAWLTPECNLYQIVLSLYNEVISSLKHVSFHNDWYCTYGPYLIWKLVLTAKDFFDQTRTATSYHLQEPIRLTVDPSSFAQNLLSQAQMSNSPVELPIVLQKLLRPAAAAQHPLVPNPDIVSPPVPDASITPRPEKKQRGPGKKNELGIPIPAQRKHCFMCLLLFNKIRQFTPDTRGPRPFCNKLA